ALPSGRAPAGRLDRFGKRRLSLFPNPSLAGRPRWLGCQCGASSIAGRALSAWLLESPAHRVPVNVGDERVHVLGAFRGRVVVHKGVLPNVHHEKWLEASQVAILMEIDPVIAERACGRVLIKNRPTDTTEAANGLEVRHKTVDCAEIALQSRL